MTRAMAMELVPDVRVNAGCPGDLDTDMIRGDAACKGPEVYDWIDEWTPMGRIGRQTRATGAILYLASDALASYVTGSTCSSTAAPPPGTDAAGRDGTLHREKVGRPKIGRSERI